MGNELSSEAASQHQQEVPIGGAMYGAEQDAFFYPENVCSIHLLHFM
jgi:hypothetical protein